MTMDDDVERETHDFLDMMRTAYQICKKNQDRDASQNDIALDATICLLAWLIASSKPGARSLEQVRPKLNEVVAAIETEIIVMLHESHGSA